MTGTGMRHPVALGLTLVLGMAAATVAAGQGNPADAMHNARRLGGSTSFYTPPLRSAASLKQMVAKKGHGGRHPGGAARQRHSGHRRRCPGDARRGHVVGLRRVLRRGDPADGTVVACDFQPGSTLRWMAYRPNARKGDRTPGRLDGVRWAGNKPFKAFLFRVTNDYKIYTFVLPMACANLSLMSVNEIVGEAVDVSVDRVCDPKTGVLSATVKAGSKDLERVQTGERGHQRPTGRRNDGAVMDVVLRQARRLHVRGDRREGQTYPVARRSRPRGGVPAAGAATHAGCRTDVQRRDVLRLPVKGAYQISVDATRSTTGASGVAPTVRVDLRDDTGAAVGQTLTLDNSLSGTDHGARAGVYRATATVSTPRVVEAGEYRYEGTATCDASVTVERAADAGTGASVFFAALGGKDRRVRPIEDTGQEFAQCSPLLGLKFGRREAVPARLGSGRSRRRRDQPGHR